jgi:hypothetical protein
VTNAVHDSALRSLDAGVGTTGEHERRRADALLERIVATPVTAAPPHAGRRRARHRLAVATAIGAALAIGSLALRATSDSGVAYASWTAVPSAVTARDLDAVVRACRDQLDDGAIPLALAERRGDFVAVLFHEDQRDL